MNKLFTPLDYTDLHFKHRIVMAPMTRCRSSQPGNVPNEVMATYYGQRASAALIVSEATQISPQGQGYSFTPGIYSAEQVAGWRLVTDAVHQHGGLIYSQLWHVGRMSHAMFQQGGAPVAPSAIAVPEGTGVWVHDGKEGKMVPCTPPRALTLDEIHAVQDDFVKAAKNAKAAGFDGIELHAANGYLIDQFLRTTSNQRTDEYGGSVENRIRFLLEIVQRLLDVFPAQRIGVRFAPHNMSRGMDDAGTPETVLAAMRELNRLGVGYVHFAEADWDEAPAVPEAFRVAAREAFSGLIIVAGNYNAERAEQVLSAGWVDLVAFGRPFVANPDFPARLQAGYPMAEMKPEYLFGGSALGYADYSAYHSAYQAG